MYDPRRCVGVSQYVARIRLNEGSLKVPKDMSPAEQEFEYLLAKLHWNYFQVSSENIEILKKIVNKLG